jgi:MshEN domain
MEPIADLAGLLVTSGLIAESDAVHLRRDAAATGQVQIRVLRETGLVSDAQVFRVLADQLGIAALDVDDEASVDLDALRWVAQDMAAAHLVLPVRVESRPGERVLCLAMVDPLCGHSVQTVERTSGCVVDPLLAEAGALTRAIQRCYGSIATKLLPRPAKPPPSQFGAWPEAGEVVEPETQPAHRLEDEASPTQMVQALVNVLTAKGVIRGDEFALELRRLLREELEE